MAESKEDKFFAYLREQEKQNEILLKKYRPGQKVKVDWEDEEPSVCEIKDVYVDYNGGPVADVFVDLTDESGAAIDRILAGNILEIVEESPDEPETGSGSVTENPAEPDYGTGPGPDVDDDIDPPF